MSSQKVVSIDMGTRQIQEIGESLHSLIVDGQVTEIMVSYTGPHGQVDTCYCVRSNERATYLLHVLSRDVSTALLDT